MRGQPLARAQIDSSDDLRDAQEDNMQPDSLSIPRRETQLIVVGEHEKRRQELHQEEDLHSRCEC
jgi:hypothetical protein